jgi:hypothetical protein
VKYWNTKILKALLSAGTGGNETWIIVKPVLRCILISITLDCDGGKSNIFLMELNNNHSISIFFSRFLGSTQESSNILFLLQSLTNQIRKIFDFPPSQSKVIEINIHLNTGLTYLIKEVLGTNFRLVNVGYKLQACKCWVQTSGL